MLRKLGTSLVAGAVILLGACTEKLDLPTGLNVDLTKARVRIANATITPFDVALDGNTVLGGGNIGVGNSFCAKVDPANPAISIFTVATTTPLPGLTLTLPTLTANKDYLVVIWPNGATLTSTGFEQGPNTPGTGAMGIRVFNAGGATGNIGAVDTHVIPTGGTVSTTTKVTAGTNVAVGALSSYFDVTTPNNLVRFTRTATTTAVTYNSITTTGATSTTGAFTGALGVTVVPGSNGTIILASPATGSTTYRAYMAGGC